MNDATRPADIILPDGIYALARAIANFASRLRRTGVSKSRAAWASEGLQPRPNAKPRRHRSSYLYDRGGLRVIDDVGFLYGRPFLVVLR
jgi:hypothetical protein